jgi:hypothetical protein
LTDQVGFDGAATLDAYVFADADLVDIRRFAGYPARGTGIVVFPFPWWFKYYQALEVRLQNLTASEAAIIQQYLTQLRTLEAAIPGSGANLDTDQAAVWTHNKNEVRDRTRLYMQWRRQFCELLGVPYGSGAQPGGGCGGGVTMVI